MSDRVFIDTNILIYAHDRDAGRKRDIAAEILLELWENKQGVVSTQVLQEFYVNVTRKIPTPISKGEARDIIDRYAVWKIIVIDPSLILRASRIEEEYQISFWDSMIVAAAEKAEAKTLFSEDLNAGQSVAGIRIENPLL